MPKVEEDETTEEVEEKEAPIDYKKDLENKSFVEVALDTPEKPEVKKAAEGLYDALVTAGVEVLYDDRGVSAGAMFAEADLIGIPWRVVVSEKTLAQQSVELKRRQDAEAKLVALTDAVRQLVA